MSWRVLLRPAAQRDIEEVYDWYDGRREGLGEEFRQVLDQLLARLASSPRMYAVSHQTARHAVRHAVLGRFPYAVFFVVEADRVEVLACLHGHRDPRFVRGRLG